MLYNKVFNKSVALLSNILFVILQTLVAGKQIDILTDKQKTQAKGLEKWKVNDFC